MITLISKESHQIKFPGGSSPAEGPPLHHTAALTVTIETGVAVFSLLGTNPHDWTRDTLNIPVGAAGPRAEYVSGIASAAPTSFWTPMNNLQATGGGSENISVNVTGSDSSGDFVSASGGGSVDFPSFPVPPPIGFAIDSAEVAYSDQSGQPLLTLALAAFGNCAALLRASYTVHIVSSSDPGIVVSSGGFEPPSRPTG